MKTYPFHIYMAPEGESTGGGGTAVADAPQHEVGSDAEFRANLAKTFRDPKSEAPQQQQRKPDPTKTTTVKRDAQQDAPAQKPVKADAKVPKSIFDAANPEAAPAEKPAEKPATSAPDPDDAIPENDWKAAKLARKELAKKLEASQAELAKYQEDLGKYRQVAADPVEADRLRREHKELSDRVALFDFQAHPDYKRQFVEPKDKIVKDVDAILRENGIEGVDIASIVNKPRAERSKLLSELEGKLNSYDIGELRMAVRDLSKLSEAEKSAMANRETLAQEYKRQSEVKMRQAFEEVQKTESLGFLAKPRDIPEDADPEEKQSIQAFNEGLRQVRLQAEKYAFAVADERSAASVATKAANFDLLQKHALPIMVADYNKLREINAQMAERLASLEGHRPGADFDGGDTGPSGQKEEDVDLKTLVRRTFHGQ